LAAESLLAAGKLGAVLVAGGQGTRLGFDHPKGMYRVGPVSHRSLFEMHVDQLRAVARRFGTRIPLYLMTSPATHAETVAYFDEHQNFGLDPDDLWIFCQGTMPAVDNRGRVLMSAKDEIFLSPDGHGGMLAAFDRQGCLEHARQRGLEQLFYFQVDNPLVKLCDRELVGFHLLSESEMSTLVVAKSAPLDKVGNVVSVDGRLMVIEYSDLPEQHANRRDDHGQLMLWAGSIAVHVLGVDFLKRAASSEASLPFHRARKKVPHLDATGKLVEPASPNATKFERFIFDLMPMAQNAIVVEGDEREVFAPLKNASGAEKDTPETTRRAIIVRANRWLERAGCKVDEGVAVEISPLLALDPDELQARVPTTLRVERDTYLTPESLRAQ
jgi:UDP-N-acetylglucosamine/UDP-N-acetylgalactosamine diphosphorylase